MAKPAAAAAAAGAGAGDHTVAGQKRAAVCEKEETESKTSKRQKLTESSVKADHDTIKAIMQKYTKFPGDDGVEVKLRDCLTLREYKVMISKADECYGGNCHKCDLLYSDALNAAFEEKLPTEQQITAFQSDMQRAIMPHCPNAFDLKLKWDEKAKEFHIDFSLRFDMGANDASGDKDDDDDE